MFEEGSSVSCGICGRETTVLFTAERENGTSYDLACRHRNAVCPTCQTLVRDDSDVLEKVAPLCRTCSPEAFQNEDDE